MQALSLVCIRCSFVHVEEGVQRFRESNKQSWRNFIRHYFKSEFISHTVWDDAGYTDICLLDEKQWCDYQHRKNRAVHLCHSHDITKWLLQCCTLSTLFIWSPEKLYFGKVPSKILFNHLRKMKDRIIPVIMIPVICKVLDRSRKQGWPTHTNGECWSLLACVLYGTYFNSFGRHSSSNILRHCSSQLLSQQKS